MSQPIRLIVSFGNMPEGWCGTPQELGQAIADRLMITSSEENASFVTGSIMPTSNVGPWLKDGKEWWVWDDNLGTYVPMQFSYLQNSLIPPGTVLEFAGAIADIPDGFLFCDGSAVTSLDYPQLFAVIGTTYGNGGGCVNGFNLPDDRDKFVVGATQDSGGIAKTNVTGVLTKNGGVTPLATHHHTVGSFVNSPAGTGAPITYGLAGDTSDTDVSPPYLAYAKMIKT